jgi:nicotinamidase-related amidase
MVVDIQQRLTAAMPEHTRSGVINNVSTLLTASDCLDVPVLVTEQYPEGLGATEKELSDKFPEETTIVEKTAFSAAQIFGVEQKLKKLNRKQIVLVGMEAHICILQTGTDLLRHGFEVFIVEDGVCSRQDHHHANAINRLRAAGAVITNTESVLFEWLGDAKHPHFKALSKLII